MLNSRAVWTAILLTCLAACSANHNSIYRMRSLGSGASIVTLDAKQRSILTAYRLLDSAGKPKADSIRMFCAEPSPDVFSVIAQSLSAGGSFGKSADPASIEAALNFAYSSAEQGSTIPRTQTINMLRELMFRTCERYLSGGYDPTELSLQAIRDQRLMVSILAIEQLTGAIAPKPAVIAATGSGGAGITGDAIIRVDDARKERDKAITAYDSAVAAYEQTNGADKVCDAIKDKKEADLTDDQKAKLKLCSDARSLKDSTLAAKTSKNAAYQELSQLAATGGVTTGTAVTSSVPGGFDTARSEAVASVSGTIAVIVERNFSDDTEVMMFCLRILRDRPEDKLNVDGVQQSNLRSVCVNYLDAGVRAAEGKLLGEMRASGQAVADGTVSNFAAFWTDARANSFSNAEWRKTFIAWLKTRMPAQDRSKADCFAGVTSANAVRLCFAALNPGQQRDAAQY